MIVYIFFCRLSRIWFHLQKYILKKERHLDMSIVLWNTQVRRKGNVNYRMITKSYMISIISRKANAQCIICNTNYFTKSDFYDWWKCLKSNVYCKLNNIEYADKLNATIDRCNVMKRSRFVIVFWTQNTRSKLYVS